MARRARSPRPRPRPCSAEIPAPPGADADLLKHITPAIKGLDPKLSGGARVDAGVEANVRASMARLSKIPEGRVLLENTEFRLVGAVYELGSGRVRFLD